MAYNINTFLKPLSQSDRLIQVIDSNGVVKYSINPFTVKNTFVRGNVIYISLNSDREILIDFRNQTESRQAIVLLESQLETLRNKTPNYIDRIIEEYIHGIGLSYSNGNLYFSANLIPSINSTFSIGLSGSNWLDLHVGTSSIYLGDVKLSSENSNLIINDSFEISSPTQSTTWLGKKLIETFTDGIVTTIDETRSQMYSEVGEVGLESYYNPDGLNNIIKGKVRTFPGGVILESSAESVSGTVSGAVVVSANGFQFNQTDGVIENNFELSDTLYINGVDYLSKGGILTQTFLINSNNYDYIINGVDSLILSSSVFDVVSDFISIDSSGSGQILADEDLTFMAGGEMSIIGSSSLITTNNGLGLVYTDDYSANFVDNSLVSKKFVLDNINSGGAGGAVDSVNGKTGVVVLNASDIAETSTLKWLTSTLKDAYDGAVSGKVDKLSGKGLSSNDFTNSDKNKLDSLSNYTGFRGAGASLSSIQTAYPTGSLGDWAIITNPSGNAYFAIWDPDVSAWIDAGQSPTIPGTNLSYSISGNTLTITSDTGTDVTIPLATGSVAGLMSFEDKLKIDSITEIFTASLKTIYDGYASQITAKASASEVATVLFKSITQTIVTGKTEETSIYSIPLPMDGSDYMIKVYSQAQISTFLGATIAHRLRIGSYASPIDGASGANSIGQQTIVAANGIGAPTQFPLSRNFIFKGGVSGSIYGISTASNIPDDANSVGVFSTLASKDFTTQYYLYVCFNPTNVGAVIQHNQILVTAIKI